MHTRVLYILALMMLVSCSWIRDDKVVARVGRDRLYMSAVQDHIPDGVSREDSAAFARQYIESWAIDRIFESVAKERIGSDPQIEEEIKNYRLSLLKYRYEQDYLSRELSPEISREDIVQYYESHKEQFNLTHPIVKARFLDVMEDAPYREFMVRRISTTSESELALLDSIARMEAIKFYDSSGEWMDARVLAREFGMDFADLYPRAKGKLVTVANTQSGEERMAYFFDVIMSGTAPLDYCESEVRDILMSVRKRELIRKLEQSLLEEAVENKRFVIY
ncbi:MAG: hypothetical protein MJY48_05540 [Bacteroidales bacterium]|nr:hypothetical protein [Bacteroidales bacterium]